MSEKPSALSTIPPPAEGEYDLICATMAESARGRWFLDEYARRNRNTDTAQVLGAIERIEAMIRGEREQQVYQSFRSELLDMAKAIAQTRADVAAIEPEAPIPATGPGAPAPAAANHDIFAAAERIQDVAWIMRERGLDSRICQQIEALASSILRASSLHNPNDHRTQKLGEVLHYLERRISAMLDACAGPALGLQEQGLTEQQAPAEGAVDQVSTDQLATDPVATDQISTDTISVDPASAYQASPDEEVEAASAPPHSGGNGHDAEGFDAATLPDQEAPATPTAKAAASVPVAPVPVATVPPPESPAPVSAEAPEPDVTVEPAPVVSELTSVVSEPASVVSEPAPLVSEEEAVAPPVAEIVVAQVEAEPQPDPAPPTPVRAAMPLIDVEPLVVVPVAWPKTPAGEPPAQLEHAPIPVEPLFPEQVPAAMLPAALAPMAEAPAAAVESAPVVELAAPVTADPAPAEATAGAIFRPPEAALVFLVEYPTPAPEDARMEAGTVTAASLLDALPVPAMTHLPEQPVPVAAPDTSVEKSAVMMADIDEKPLVQAPAETPAPAPQPHVYSLPPAEPIPQPVAAPAAATPAASATSDPLAALRAMTPEERIALFT